MIRLLRLAALLTGVLAATLIVAVVVIYFVAEARLNRVYDIPPELIEIPADAASVERGRRLATFVRCHECHGNNLAGAMYIDSSLIGQLVARNLTSGKGGIGGEYSDSDWVNALRHGIVPDGKSLLITPAIYYYQMSDSDVGALVAFIKSVRPVDRELPPNSLGPLGRVFLLFEDSWLPAEGIDHTGPRPPVVAPGVTRKYGEYLVQIGGCQVCHQGTYQVAGWTEADFLRAMRSGLAPGGILLENSYMPWRNTTPMSDDDLRAMWLYLESIASGP